MFRYVLGHKKLKKESMPQGLRYFYPILYTYLSWSGTKEKWSYCEAYAIAVTLKGTCYKPLFLGKQRSARNNEIVEAIGRPYEITIKLEICNIVMGRAAEIKRNKESGFFFPP